MNLSGCSAASIACSMGSAFFAFFLVMAVVECCGTGENARPAGIQEAARLIAPSGSPRTAICWQASGDVDLHFDEQRVDATAAA